MNAVVQAYIINGVQLVLLFSVFGVLTYFPTTLGALAPRLRVENPDEKTLVVRVFHFIHEACRTTPEELSVDGQVIVRFCNLGLKFSLVGCIVSAFLAPVYGSDTTLSEQFDNAMQSLTFQSYTITNCHQLWQGWCIGFATLVLTGTFAYLMWFEWLHFVGMRHRYFTRAASGVLGHDALQTHHSVMVESIPANDRTVERVREKLSLVGKVQAVTLVQNTRNLQVTKAIGLQKIKPNMRDMCPPFADEEEELKVTSVAFVTFSTVVKRMEALQLLLFRPVTSEGLRRWAIKPAPEARDILWWNIGISRAELKTRRILGTFLTTLGVLFWSGIVVSIQLVVSIDRLDEYMPEFTQWWQEKHKTTFSIVTQYLPVLSLIGLQTLLPYVLKALSSSVEGLKTKSEVERVALGRNVAYQLATLYMTILSGSIWDFVRVTAEKPACAVYILGQSVPRSASFFHTYIIARIGTSLPLLLLYPILFGGAWTDVYPCSYVYECTSLALVLVLALTYSIIAPLLMPACAVYFGMASIIYRYLFRYVYTAEFDIQGALWYQLYNGSLVGEFLGTLTLVGIALHELGNDSVLFWASTLPPCLIAYLVKRCRRFQWMSSTFPLELARRVDARCQGLTFSPDYYIDPVLNAVDSSSSASCSSSDA
eukprot:TRINITY_DN7841_c0_g2_i1.p1 TRINITY_DN7841_c0_g2~~TRINITY_DN7841_c0_g2_i1.p1  ORF type:complete len:713 (+),score=50.11 TRINITY_DN7841_c0_g2_i1:186-2141(+)